jgi:hypothetical protein
MFAIISLSVTRVTAQPLQFHHIDANDGNASNSASN